MIDFLLYEFKIFLQLMKTLKIIIDIVEDENVDIKQIQLDKSNGLYVKKIIWTIGGIERLRIEGPRYNAQGHQGTKKIPRDVASTRVKTILYYIYFETKDCGGSMIRKTLGNIGKAQFGF
jgi:hypothetical protein